MDLERDGVIARLKCHLAHLDPSQKAMIGLFRDHVLAALFGEIDFHSCGAIQRVRHLGGERVAAPPEGELAGLGRLELVAGGARLALIVMRQPLAGGHPFFLDGVVPAVLADVLLGRGFSLDPDRSGAGPRGAGGKDCQHNEPTNREFHGVSAREQWVGKRAESAAVNTRISIDASRWTGVNG